jgi:hypothetical protein
MEKQNLRVHTCLARIHVPRLKSAREASKQKCNITTEETSIILMSHNPIARCNIIHDEWPCLIFSLAISLVRLLFYRPKYYEQVLRTYKLQAHFGIGLYQLASLPTC